MLKKLNGRSSTMMCGIALIAFSGMTQAADLTVYGKIHLSGDAVDNGTVKDYTIASNSSRIGFKGDKKLKYGLKAIWKIESGIDIEQKKASSGLSARNRYLGLKHSAGSVIAGYHDTPFKSFGGKVGLFADTIADRRGILGSGNGSNKFNTRGAKSVMYISPKISGIEVRAMWATGALKSATVSDKDPITSVSAMYKTKMFYVGAAFEDQKSLEATGLRVGGGVKVGNTKINAMFEKLSSDKTGNEKYDRSAYGASVAHKMGDTTLKAQAFMMGDYKDKADSGGSLFGLGVDHKLDKKFSVYAIFAMANNDENTMINLAASGHGTKYVPAAGKDPKGASIGAVYKF